MTGWQHVDFQTLVGEVCQSQVGKGELTILGGKCAENQLLKFLEQWDLVNMPLRVWEYVSEVVLKKTYLIILLCWSVDEFLVRVEI